MSDAIEGIACALAVIDGHDPDEQWEEWTRSVGEDGHLISYPRIRWREYETPAFAAYFAIMQHLKRELALTELANIEGATDQWLDGFRFAASRLGEV